MPRPSAAIAASKTQSHITKYGPIECIACGECYTPDRASRLGWGCEMCEDHYPLGRYSAYHDHYVVGPTGRIMSMVDAQNYVEYVDACRKR